MSERADGVIPMRRISDREGSDREGSIMEENRALQALVFLGKIH